MKIYLAGKISKNGWRKDLFKDDGFLRDVEWFDNYKTNGCPEFPIYKSVLLEDHDYVGPYFVSDDHGCGHNPRGHGVGIGGNYCTATWLGEMDANDQWEWRTTLYKSIEKAIMNCDAIFAWIDSETCYGTLVEIGIGKALNKIIYASSPMFYEELWIAYKASTKISKEKCALTAFQDGILRDYRQQKREKGKNKHLPMFPID